MKNLFNLRKWWCNQVADFKEFSETLGLKQGLQQMAVGMLLGVGLLLACGLGEWLEKNV